MPVFLMCRIKKKFHLFNVLDEIDLCLNGSARRFARRKRANDRFVQEAVCEPVHGKHRPSAVREKQGNSQFGSV